MWIYLDDIRNPSTDPNIKWVVVRTAKEAIRHIEGGTVKYISFDHDLGQQLTGYDVAKRIEQLVIEGVIDPPHYFVHSANPVGKQNITRAMQSAWKHFGERGQESK